MKRVAFMLAASFAVAIPAAAAMASSPAEPNGLLPDVACVAVSPEPINEPTCGK